MKTVEEIVKSIAFKMYPDYTVTHHDACDQGHYGYSWDETVDRSRQRNEAEKGLLDFYNQLKEQGYIKQQG